MSGRLSEIKGIRDAVLVIKFSENGEEQEPLGEGKRVRTKKRRGAEAQKSRVKDRQSYRSQAAQISRKMKKKRKTSAYKKSQAEIENLGPSRKGTRRMTNKEIRRKTAPVAEEFERWIQDVDEAVDQFIGMPLEVLPRMPWERWFNEGMSPVVAAKNAVQMHEDMDEDDEYVDEDDEYDDDDGDDELGDNDDVNEGYAIAQMDTSDYLQDLLGIKHPRNPRPQTYQKWVVELNKKFKSKSGQTLESLKGEGVINNEMIHSWYMSGFAASKSAKILADALKKLGHKKSKIEKGRTKSVRVESVEHREDVVPKRKPRPMPRSERAAQLMVDQAAMGVDVTPDMVGEIMEACAGVNIDDGHNPPKVVLPNSNARPPVVREESEDVEEAHEQNAPESEPEGEDSNDE